MMASAAERKKALSTQYTKSGIGRPRLLVIDSDTVFIACVHEIILDLGYRIEATAWTRQAMDHCRTFVPDAILLGNTTPEIDNPDLIAWLREQGSRVKLLIVRDGSRPHPAATGIVEQLGGELPIEILDGPVSPRVLRGALARFSHRHTEDCRDRPAG